MSDVDLVAIMQTWVALTPSSLNVQKHRFQTKLVNKIMQHPDHSKLDHSTRYDDFQVQEPA